MPATPAPRSIKRSITYMSLIKHIAEHLGAVYFPLNPDADSPLTLVLPESAYHSILKEIVIRIYQENRARHLQSPVSLFPSLDAIGAIRGRLSREQTDIEQIALVDRIGALVVAYFPASTPSTTTRRSERRLQHHS